MPHLDLHGYDLFAIAFSGGKDSICCLLSLLEAGVDPAKIELHHHLVDGREGSTLFDWPCTQDYCRKLAQAFDIPIYFSWLEGGLEREMCRQDQPKAPTHFETPQGERVAGGNGPLGTRQKFPAKSADLRVRWCSAYAKIDVLSMSINNQTRFNHKRSLVITGERAEESVSRAQYPTFCRHRCDRRDSSKLGRWIDHWRPVHSFTREQVWAILRQWGIVAHPAYYLGWGRLSCQRCIFGSPNQWASNDAIAPGPTNKLHSYEREFNHTLDNKFSIPQLAAKGTPYPSLEPEYVKLALSRVYSGPVRVDQQVWLLPAGAHGEIAGPS